MLFPIAMEKYISTLNRAANRAEEKKGADSLGRLVLCLTELMKVYKFPDQEREKLRKETDAAIMAYLERERKGARDKECKPIVRFIHEALKKDDLLYPKIKEWDRENKYVYLQGGKNFDWSESLARVDRIGKSSYEDLYQERLQSLVERMDRTAQEALWNSSEFKEMHNALKRCMPGEIKNDDKLAIDRLNEVISATVHYLDEKSLDPFTQRGRERVELARQLLNASQELMADCRAKGEVEKKPVVELDAKAGIMSAVSQMINEKRAVILKFLNENPNLDLKTYMESPDFSLILGSLEHLRIQKKHVEQGTFFWEGEGALSYNNYISSSGIYEKLSPVLLQIKTKEQLLALINREEPVLRQKENGDWVSPAQLELEDFFQNIEPVTMQQGPGQGESKAEEILIPLPEIEPEEELLPQQNVIDQDAQDAQEEQEFLEMLNAPRPKEEEELFRGGNPILMDENPILMDEVQEEEEWKIDPTGLQMDKNEDFAAGELAPEGRLEDIQLLDDDLPFMTAERFNKMKKADSSSSKLLEEEENLHLQRVHDPLVFVGNALQGDLFVKENKIFEVITSLPAIIRTRQQALIREIPKEDFRTDAAFKEKFTLLEHLKLLQSTVERYGNNREKWKGFDDLPYAVTGCFTVRNYREAHRVLGGKVDSYMKIVPDEEQLQQDINDPLPALKKYDKNAKQKVKEEKGKNSGAGKKQEPGNDSKKGKELKLV